MDYIERQDVTKEEFAKNALASFGFVRPKNGFVLGFGAAVGGVFDADCEQHLSLPRVATDGGGKCVDRGGGFGRVPMALPPVIWEVGSCL